MTTIYIVTSGEYSNYRINAVFDSKDKAEAFIAYETAHHHYHRGFDIEEWALNEYFDPISKGLSCYHVAFADITKGDAQAAEYGASEESENAYTIRSTGVRNYSTAVWAQDEQAALKIANERRVRYVLRLEHGQHE